MGEPVLDLDGRRLERTVLKAQANEQVRRMYGASDHLIELVRRVRAIGQMHTRVPGHVVYDVDPIVFDDLIEVRTGGDRAVSALIDTGGFWWASFWPVVRMSPNDVLSGWEETLSEASERPHSVLVEVNSILEQALTFDFGYKAYARDTARLRRLTSDRFFEELRATQLDEGRARVIRPPRTAAAVHLNPVGYINPDLEWVPETPPWTTVGTSTTQVTVDRTVVTAWDGGTVRVDRNGCDAMGHYPLDPGYSSIRDACNCNECRTERLIGNDPDPHEADDDYEEDEEG